MPADGTKLEIEFGEDGRSAYESQTAAYRQKLSRTPDDMWSAFADAAEPGVFLVDRMVAGCLSLSDRGELHRLHVQLGFEHLADDFVDVLIDSRTITSMIVSTADPLALSVLAPRAVSVATASLLYELGARPTGQRQEQLRAAGVADRDRSVLFVDQATETTSDPGPGYLDQRIERGELFLHEVGGEIVAIGERRIDRDDTECAHVGVIVGAAHRNRGLGTAVLTSLVDMSIRDGLKPLCSTEPDNVAAQRMIRGAGFMSRHSMLRLVPARL